MYFRRFLGTALRWPIRDVRVSEKTKELEQFWAKPLSQDFLSKKQQIGSKNEKQKKYILSMFPYPSGRLHIGHMRVYTISDATARYYRLNGFEVIHPIGWDSFGLPAENAARNQGVDSREWTLKNIETMREQLQKTQIQFDWDREISTCEPEFFRWTQWIFCKLYEKGLVKRVTAEVNWDPVDKTVLAAEQIDSEGKSWRSGAVAEKMKLRQWMIETPKYAKKLQEGLRKLAPQWGEVADIQANWIGKCDVWRFLFPLRDQENGKVLDEKIDIRIKDIFQISNAEFLIVNKNHSLVADKNFETPYISPIQVLNGVTGRYMPIIVVDENYKNEIEMFKDSRIGDFEKDKDLCEKFSIKPSGRVLKLNKNDIVELAAFGGYGGYETSRTLSDWVVSRQRAWGTPIPMIMREDGSAIAVEEKKLPVLGSQRGQTTDAGIFDTDTLDTFFDSAWYYLRYLDPKNGNELISPAAAQKMPVDVYVGGIEHAAVHMFFARFIAYFLNDLKILPENEPFIDLIPQGIVRGKTFIEKSTGKYLRAEEINENEMDQVETIYEKMSKSKNNGVDLAAILESDGVDMTRLRLLEAAAPRAPINWGESDLKGIKKLLDRIATITSEMVANQGKPFKSDKKIEEEIKEAYNFFVRNIGMCLEVLHLHNTALMRIQGFTNALKKIDAIYLANSPEGRNAVQSLIIMLQVFCPNIAAELWAGMCPEQGLVSQQSWPLVDFDAKIEFLLIVDGVSCGRPSLDRRNIEGFENDEIWRMAKENEHSEFLRLLEENGVTIEKKTVTSRNGFHVTLSLNLAGNKEENRKIIGNILDTLQAERRKKEKKIKKKKIASV
ncbi:unnamed protein product [Caenorhabditis angaria]|uniref:leucine--tRNA ligase n=1 Tax=Caenorhabditis angaria TaxID=860376 RepID=A0A9P1I6N6_9PELO|nr:unnamed protein product [Caenorhabditis angaria]